MILIIIYDVPPCYEVALCSKVNKYCTSTQFSRYHCHHHQYCCQCSGDISKFELKTPICLNKTPIQLAIVETVVYNSDQ